MDFKTFIEDHFEINGPAYRGAEMPDFDPSKINEENFDDGRRPKEVSWKWENNVFYINWVSQEYGEFDSFFEEIRRWKDYIVSRALEDGEIDLGRGDEWDFPLVVILSCRDDDEEDDAIVQDISCSFDIE